MQRDGQSNVFLQPNIKKLILLKTNFDVVKGIKVLNLIKKEKVWYEAILKTSKCKLLLYQDPQPQ